MKPTHQMNPRSRQDPQMSTTAAPVMIVTLTAPGMRVTDSSSDSGDSDSSSDNNDSDTCSDDNDADSSDESSDDVLVASSHPSEVSYEVQEPIDKSSLLDNVPEASVHMAGETTYELVQKSSQRLMDKLIDSDGYTYNLHKKRGTTAYWQCTAAVHNKTVNCKATVLQKGDEFKPGMNSHIHSGLPGVAMVNRVMKEVKEKATYDHSKSAAAIAEEVVLSCVGNNPTPALPSIYNLASCANHLRKKMRPPELQELDFQLKMKTTSPEASLSFM